MCGYIENEGIWFINLPGEILPSYLIGERRR
jgi:hypothetical protein